MTERIFNAKPAVLSAMPLFIGLTGPSSSGKTTSALRLATGIQRVVGGDIDLIDTENKRALMYSKNFKFNHVEFEPPYDPLDYLAALAQSAKRGAKTVIVDSASHEHEGIGGLLDAHERELDRIAGDDWRKRQACAMLAWQKPKAGRRKLLQGLTRLGVNVIMCFRAKTTSKPIKDKNGKTEIVPMGFMPIAGDEFVYEMTLGCLLLPCSDGVPTWRTENIGEKMAIKLPLQFREMIREGEPLSEDIGQKLAEWAQGGAKPEPTADMEALTAAGMTAANQGEAALGEWWKGLSKSDKAAMKSTLDCTLKSVAAHVDTPADSPVKAF